jgi:salicylate hydroxylase
MTDRVQGAAQGMEDAECLAQLFSQLTHHDQIPDVLKIFQDIRQERCVKIAKRAREYGKVLVYEDGPVQQERDRQLREHETFDGYPSPYLDVKLQDWVHGYDVAKAARETWEKYQKGEWPGTTGAYRWGGASGV